MRRGFDPAGFKVLSNYVALPAAEAFGIEYWAMEEAKIRRQPPEKKLSRRVVLVVGGTDATGREAVAKAAALKAAADGAHVVVASSDIAAAERIAEEMKSVTSAEFVASTEINVESRPSIVQALRPRFRPSAAWTSSSTLMRPPANSSRKKPPGSSPSRALTALPCCPPQPALILSDSEFSTGS